MTTETRERKRRPAARHRDVIIGAIEEHLRMLGSVTRVEDIPLHTGRLAELFDELKRAVNKEEGE